MKDLKLNLLRHHQREERKEELKKQQWLLDHPKVEDKVQVRKNVDAIKSQLEHLSPEPLTGPEKDRLYNLEKRLATRIAQGMPTDETMRKNPVGAVHHHRTWEKVNKPLINAWKNIRIQLNPDSDDKDLSNVERLRPSGQMDRLRTDAQIPGHMSYTDIPEDLWPFAEPANTAAKQAARVKGREAAEIERGILEVSEKCANAEPINFETGRRKRKLTPEYRKVLSARLAKARTIRSARTAAEREAMAKQPAEVPVTTE